MEEQTCEVGAECLDLCSQDVPEEVKTTFPFFIFLIVLICHGTYHEKVIFMILIWVSLVDYEIILRHDAKLGHQRVLLLPFNDEGEGVSHDGNQHV